MSPEFLLTLPRSGRPVLVSSHNSLLLGQGLPPGSGAPQCLAAGPPVPTATGPAPLPTNLVGQHLGLALGWGGNDLWRWGMKIYLFNVFKVPPSLVSFVVPLKSSQGKPERPFLLLPAPRAPATCTGGESPPCHTRTHTSHPRLGARHAGLKQGASKIVGVPKMH